METPIPPTRRCWYLTGPTASGKTAVGIALAQGLGAEIISLDSMALYRGLDIGTAKPSAQQRRVVPHHLLDLVDPHEEFSLAEYLEAAQRVAGQIEARGRVPLFVGGTPLYLKSLLRGIFAGPPADLPLRRRLADEARDRGPQWLHQRLQQVDPVAAGRLHPNDIRRVIRALEVHAKTGQPISRLQRQFDRPGSSDTCRVYVLHWPRELLYGRIDQRVEAMFAEGLVDEVRGLKASGRPLSRTARQALGYREVLEHLDGRRSLDETVELVKTRTRQFAKRQMTWFRSLGECRWVPMGPQSQPAEVARQILQGSDNP